MVLTPHVADHWVIADDDPLAYSLSGRLSVWPTDQVPEMAAGHVWRGVIELPAVQIAPRAR
jgi:hypothetical protein